MRILIVDDLPDSQVLLKSFLMAGGYTDLLIAGSSLDAFKLLGMENPEGVGTGIDLILMDILMPGLDGIETCHLIKATECLRDIPIIVVTATDELKYIEMALDAGALDYINKPVSRVELLARVRSALKLKHEIDRRKALEQELAELKRQVKKVN